MGVAARRHQGNHMHIIAADLLHHVAEHAEGGDHLARRGQGGGGGSGGNGQQAGGEQAVEGQTHGGSSGLGGQNLECYNITILTSQGGTGPSSSAGDQKTRRRERKSVVAGKRGAVRVQSGGRGTR